MDFMAPPIVRDRMPVAIEKHVEKHCYLPLEGLLVPLSYNMFLIILCSVYGFLSRKLPQNFNESWYIFVSVSTTTFIWVVFIPAYFSTSHTYHQAALLAFCLILNSSITLLCIFLPKLYAIYYVDKAQLQFGTGMSGSEGVVTMSSMASGQQPTNFTGSINKVAPLPQNE